MKKVFVYDERLKKKSLEDAMGLDAQGCMNSRGTVEDLQESVRRLARAVSNLVEILVVSGVIKPDDVYSLVGSAFESNMCSSDYIVVEDVDTESE